MKRVLTVLSLSVASLVVGVTAAPGTASAEERTCRGTIGARTVDNLRVPSGATCRLQGTSVKGTVKVERNAKLFAENIRVIGNVQAENHRHVAVIGARVGGSIQLKQGGSATLRRNVVRQDVQLFTNNGTQTVTRNRIDGNLQCKENRPAPTGGANVVGGNKEDQCRRL